MTNTEIVPRRADRADREPPERPPLVDAALADELLARAQSDGVELVPPDGLLSQVTKAVLERALGEEMSQHLGYDNMMRPAVDRAIAATGRRVSGYARLRRQTRFGDVGPDSIHRNAYCQRGQPCCRWRAHRRPLRNRRRIPMPGSPTVGTCCRATVLPLAFRSSPSIWLTPTGGVGGIIPQVRYYGWQLWLLVDFM